MWSECPTCKIPLSTYATRVFCIYCKFTRDSAQKTQGVTLRATGLATLFKLPTFKGINPHSLTANVGGIQKFCPKDFMITIQQGETFVKFFEAPTAESIIVLQWEST